MDFQGGNSHYGQFVCGLQKIHEKLSLINGIIVKTLLTSGGTCVTICDE